MDGGCFDIWFEKPLAEYKKERLLRYQKYLRIITAVLFRFGEPEIKPGEKEQVRKAIGYLPEQSLKICTFIDILFVVGEEILRNFGGYFHVAIGSDQDPDKIQGGKHIIYMDPDDDDPESYLLDEDEDEDSLGEEIPLIFNADGTIEEGSSLDAFFREDEDDLEIYEEDEKPFYYLMDAEFTRNFLNADFPDEDRKLFAISNIDRIDVDRYPPRYDIYGDD